MEEISYINNPIDYIYHYKTIPERLKCQAEQCGDKEVYVFLSRDGKRAGVSTRELHKKSLELSKALVSLGIQKGDIIALCLQNDYDGLVCLFGVIYAGAVVLNVVSAKEDGSDLHGVLSKVGATALIIHPGPKSATFAACMHFLDECKSDGTVVCSAVPTLKLFLTTTYIDDHQTLTLKSLFDTTFKIDLPKLDPDDIATLFPTSGSTGEPKFVPMTHFRAMIIGHQLHESIGYDKDGVIYSERRFAWIGGFPFMLLHNGVKVVTKVSGIPTMDEHCKFTMDALLKERCTHACLLPATIVGLNDILSKPSSESKLPILMGIQTGALPVASICFSGLGKVASRITNCYGSSEAGFVTSLHVKERRGKLDYNTGPPLQGVEAKVVDFKGFVVRRGDTGAVYVRSPSLFTGYFKNKQKTSEVLSDSRWFNTNDVGSIDHEGNLFITGRQSDIIQQGGKDYYPSSVESFIKQHPLVLDVIVVPVPDEIMFQLVCACVIAKPGTNLTSSDLRDFYQAHYLDSANEAFGGFIPRMFLIFDEYPRLYTGKPDKKRLIQEAIKRRHEN